MLEVYLDRAKFQSSAKFTSQGMGFQICAIGISYETLFRRAGHNYTVLSTLKGTKTNLLKRP